MRITKVVGTLVTCIWATVWLLTLVRNVRQYIHK